MDTTQWPIVGRRQDDGHRHKSGVGAYVSEAIIDGIREDGTIYGHYGNTVPDDGRCMWCGALPPWESA